MTRLPTVLVLVVVIGMLFAGCRTYGSEEFDSQRKVYAAVQTSVEQLEQELSRAEASLQQLESAAESMDTLSGLADRYHSLVSAHKTTLDSYRADAKTLEAGSSFRTLRRTYGAIVTDRRLLQRQYDRTTRLVWATVRDTTVPQAPVRLQSTYPTTPIGFPDPEREPVMTMSSALRGADGTPGLE